MRAERCGGDARTWGRIVQTPVVRVRGRGSGRVSMAGMACFEPGRRSRLIYVIREYRGRKEEPKGFGRRDFRDLVVRARIQLGGTTRAFRPAAPSATSVREARPCARQVWARSVLSRSQRRWITARPWPAVGHPEWDAVGLTSQSI